MEGEVNITNVSSTFCEFEINSDTEFDVQYPVNNSTNVQKVIFINVTDKNKDKGMSFVLKALGRTVFRKYFENCYHNELVLYTMVFPHFIKKDSKYIIPKCLDAKPIHLIHIGKEPTYLALENLCKRGFKMSVRDDMLIYDEIVCASLALGQFHGDCFSFKMLSPQTYENVMSNLIDVETGYEENEYHTSWMIWREVLFYCAIEKIVQKSNKVEIIKKAKYLLEILNAVGLREFMAVISKSREPLSVLSHGDINRSNMMFKYNDNNEPIACAFIDFQISSVSSPAKDLFSLIFLNIRDSKERRSMWDGLWYKYWKSLVERISINSESNISELPMQFSLKSLQDDFNLMCCAYLPNIITYLYSYYGEKRSVDIHTEHVEAKKIFLQNNIDVEMKMKSKTITSFDYEFYKNAINCLENNEIHQQVDGLLTEYFTYYYYEYPKSLFEN